MPQFRKPTKSKAWNGLKDHNQATHNGFGYPLGLCAYVKSSLRGSSLLLYEDRY